MSWWVVGAAAVSTAYGAYSDHKGNRQDARNGYVLGGILATVATGGAAAGGWGGAGAGAGSAGGGVAAGGGTAAGAGGGTAAGAGEIGAGAGAGGTEIGAGTAGWETVGGSTAADGTYTAGAGEAGAGSNWSNMVQQMPMQQEQSPQRKQAQLGLPAQKQASSNVVQFPAMDSSVAATGSDPAAKGKALDDQASAQTQNLQSWANLQSAMA